MKQKDRFKDDTLEKAGVGNEKKIPSAKKLGKRGEKMGQGSETIEDLKKTGEILYLPCAKLIDNPLHLGFYIESHLESLSRSIHEQGLLDPVLVASVTNGEYLILSGHYRVRAVRRLRWKQVLCRVITCDSRTAALIYCISNLLSRGLSPIEEGYAISRLIKEEKFTLTEIGKYWHRSKSWVSRRMALLVHLEPKLLKDLGAGQLSPRVAQELLRLPRGNQDQERVLQLIRSGHLNKDEAAQLVTCWMEATEAEKKAMEKNSDPNEAKEASPLYTGKQLTLFVSKWFSQCIRILDRITDLTEHQPVLSWWPVEAYTSFRDHAGRLESILKIKKGSSGE